MAEKKGKKKIIIGIAAVGGFFLAMDILAKRKEKTGEITNENNVPVSAAETGIYETIGKRCMDKAVSFISLALLSPVFLLIGLAVYIDDPGPIFFTQKRVGKDKRFFYLHKFRTMKMETPHDVPTHQLENPEQYITRVGKFLRRTSLDELPQLWDIFRGKMSIVGPRPALWNQDDLIAERDKYGANEINPGLTGWAQINGRDELKIPDKAQLDGEYVRHLRQGGLRALLFDVRCILGTVKNVLAEDGVVEGGTGSLDGGKSGDRAEKDAGFEDYAYKKKFAIDTSAANHKRVLITGAGSYIGDSFAAYAKEKYEENFIIDTVDMLDGSWREKDFSSYDAVFHVAGIAHADVGNVDEETKRKYYAVNADLAVETAGKAREEGVKQFILMSSMIIYGDSAPYGKQKVIDEYTVPSPSNFYGDSKWQADKEVRNLETQDFRVAVLRPPMIYGRGSKGNYPLLAKMAGKLPLFPAVDNSRSMLYIGNLCEFLCLLILSGENGIYFPQNEEYVKTADLVQRIADTVRHPIKVTRLLNPAVAVASHVPGKLGILINKAFGNSVYSQKLSVYEGLDYCVADTAESINRTEGAECTEKPSVLILVNHDVVIYNFRMELVERLLSEGYEVHISSPRGEHTEELIASGAHFHEADIDRHGMNPKKEFRLLMEYRRLIRRIHPAAVLTYTVKPNVYGGIVSREAGIPYIANITGLGTAVNGGGVSEKLILLLYRFGLRGAGKVFFQNEENKDYMVNRHIISGSYAVLPGSGVNLKTHAFEHYPEDADKIVFVTVGRIMRDKGTDELLEAAAMIKQRYPSVTFRLIGFFDDDYEAKIRDAEKKGVIEYIGQQKDIHPWMREAHALIHPSYHEGMSNVLLEAAATGRPVLTSDIPGCRETFDEGISGFGFKPQDVDSLVKTIERFINIPHEQKALMGKNGRRKMEQEFSRDIVVEKYMHEIRNIRRT